MDTQKDKKKIYQDEEQIPDKYLKPYSAKEVEPTISAIWDVSDLSNPDTCIKKGITKSDALTFSLVMPPPNVTGVLHMGHAMGLTVQDILTRFHRARGYRTLWLPGTDHAAIATQSKVEKEIQKKEGKSRHDLGREELLRRVSEFAKGSHDSIVNQTRALGASCDWSREAYTLDQTRNTAVNTVFKMMYDDGVIYRGYRVVNWDPKGGTTISDDEQVKEERQGVLYTFKYWKDFPIEISSTRPETKFGDVAVAVHPSDERYTHLVGTTHAGDFLGTPLSIRIIADEAVEKDFGTGALGVTPAHSYIDWQMGVKHGLPLVQVINEYGKLMVGPEGVVGMKSEVAKVKVIELLKERGLVSKEEVVIQQIPTAERTGAVIEPLPKLQWFIDVNKEFAFKGEDKSLGFKKGEMVTLKHLMRSVVETGQIQITPDFETKKYLHWIDNLQDWCISRQIWFGHRIPAWYRGEEIFCSTQAPEGEGWVQDEDTLDTWFSSGLWTFSTLGWPEKTRDFETYRKTSVIDTGYDILFFWLAKMVLMTTYTLGEIPFKNVYLHGLIRDAQGRKMSKSLGNAMDPLEMTEKYGTDAVRMALVVGSSPGIDMKLTEDKIKAYSKFSNKLWNIARFVFTAAHDVKYTKDFAFEYPQNTTLLLELENVKVEITGELEKYLFHIVAEKLYHYAWDRLASEILEDSKQVFESGSELEKLERKQVLLHLLRNSLLLLHPFMPFITEEIWRESPFKNGDMLLMGEQW
jgi:valyl-tRNA synthetase